MLTQLASGGGWLESHATRLLDERKGDIAGEMARFGTITSLATRQLALVATSLNLHGRIHIWRGDGDNILPLLLVYIHGCALTRISEVQIATISVLIIMIVCCSIKIVLLENRTDFWSRRDFIPKLIEADTVGVQPHLLGDALGGIIQPLLETLSRQIPDLCEGHLGWFGLLRIRDRC